MPEHARHLPLHYHHHGNIHIMPDSFTGGVYVFSLRKPSVGLQHRCLPITKLLSRTKTQETSANGTPKVPCARKARGHTVHDYGYVVPLFVLETHL
jgi:hypothetical protein